MVRFRLALKRLGQCLDEHNMEENQLIAELLDVKPGEPFQIDPNILILVRKVGHHAAFGFEIPTHVCISGCEGFGA